MNKWICHNKEGLPVVIKIAINTAGFMIAKNNPELAKRALPVAKGIQETIDNGVNNEAMNALLKEAIGTLVGKIDADPIILAAVNMALTQLKIDVAGNIPLTFDNQTLRDIIDSFVAGLETAVKG